MLVLILTLLLAASAMDMNPTVIQLMDGLEFPVLPRNPSVDDPLNVWYIKVSQYNSLDSPRHFTDKYRPLAFLPVLTRASRRSCDDHEELRQHTHG